MSDSDVPSPKANGSGVRPPVGTQIRFVHSQFDTQARTCAQLFSCARRRAGGAV
ncbi:unnamed protein product, partial [Mycena citricolor]